MADATTAFVDQYGMKFTDEETKALIEYFNSRVDVKGNLKYRMFNKSKPFRDAITEHTLITLSRIHTNTIQTITIDYLLRPISIPHVIAVSFNNPSMNDIEQYYDPQPLEELDTPNLAIMAIVDAEGPKHTKRYEACIFNPEFDLVNDSIRFV